MYTLYIMHVTYASTSTIQAYTPCINFTTATMHALYAYVTCVNRIMHVCIQCHTQLLIARHTQGLKSHLLSNLCYPKSVPSLREAIHPLCSKGSSSTDVLVFIESTDVLLLYSVNRCFVYSRCNSHSNYKYCCTSHAHLIHAHYSMLYGAYMDLFTATIVRLSLIHI